jgi:branched-chain amino acid transport system substrate-binding protein
VPKSRVIKVGTAICRLPGWKALTSVGVAVLGIISVGIGEAAASQQAKTKLGTVQVGIIATTTGDFAAYGQPYLNGVEAAVKYFQQQKSVNFSLEVRNGGNDPATNVTVVRNLSSSGIHFVLSYDGSPASLAAAAVAESSGTLFMTGATDTAIPKAGKWIFQAPTQTSAIAAKGMIAAVQRLHLHKIAIVADNDSYGVPLAAQVKAIGKKDGISVVTDQLINPTSTDYGAQVGFVVKARPQAVVFAAYGTPEGALFAKQARAAGVTVPFIGTNSWGSSSVLSLMGAAAAKNVYAVLDFLPIPSSLTPIGKTFVTLYKKMYKSVPNTYAASGFDQVLMLETAMVNAKSTSPSLVRTALASVDVDGATGSNLHFSGRSIQKSAIFAQASKGAWVPWASR